MEFVDGPTLQAVAEHHRWLGEPLPQASIAYIAREILSGLEFAYGRARDHKGRLLRVVHRDLSPSNILIGHSGQVKISDFGVARALRQRQKLKTHHMVGKPSYMAPEQLRNESIDARVDVFSVGVLIWELLCNRRLFLRDNEAATRMAVLACEVPLPSDVRPELGKIWDGFIRRAVSEDRGARFADAVEMGLALANLPLDGGIAQPSELAVVLEQVSEESLPELDLEDTGEHA
jgi:serine/threonine protein kinase